MLARISLLRPRKKQILTILIDCLICFFILQNSKLSPNLIGFILITWIPFCYVLGKYIFKELKLILIIKRQFLVSIASIAFFIILINLFSIIFPNDTIFFSTEFLREKLFKIIFTSFIFNSFFNFMTKNSNLKNTKWGFIGSKNKYEFLMNDLNSCKDNYNISFIDEDIISSKYDDIYGLIIDQTYKSKLSLDIYKYNKNKKIYTLTDWLGYFIERYPTNLISDYFIYEKIINKDLSNFQFRIKRLNEIIFSIFLIIITFPIFFISVIFVYLEDKKMPFYVQKRSGQDNKIFKIIKIRTMIKSAEKGTAIWAKKNDVRITNVGNFLRKFRIDELPQLLNVLNGSMSLIGPRPERPEIDNYLAENIKYYNYRYIVRPGISGWAQVNYPYGSSLEDSKNKLSYDIFYIKNYSILLDILILFKTIRMLIKGEGYNPRN